MPEWCSTVHPCMLILSTACAMKEDVCDYYPSNQENGIMKEWQTETPTPVFSVWI